MQNKVVFLQCKRLHKCCFFACYMDNVHMSAIKLYIHNGVFKKKCGKPSHRTWLPTLILIYAKWCVFLPLLRTDICLIKPLRAC